MVFNFDQRNTAAKNGYNRPANVFNCSISQLLKNGASSHLGLLSTICRTAAVTNTIIGGKRRDRSRGVVIGDRQAEARICSSVAGWLRAWSSPATSVHVQFHKDGRRSDQEVTQGCNCRLCQDRKLVSHTAECLHTSAFASATLPTISFLSPFTSGININYSLLAKIAPLCSAGPLDLISRINLISIIYANIQSSLHNFVAPCHHIIHTKFH